MKQVYALLCCVAFIGLVFMGVGTAMGGARSVDLYNSRFSLVNLDADTVSEETDPIKDIKISVGSAKVEFVDSDYYGYEIESNTLSQFKYNFSNGRLTIEQRVSLGIINIGINKMNTVKVCIPRDVELDSVDVKAASGSFVSTGFTAKELEIGMSSGRTALSNVKADKLSIKGSSGSITLSDSSFENADVRLTSGSLNLNDITTNGLDINMTSGSANISGTLTGENNVTSTSGSIRMQINGKTEDYSRNISATSGSIHINGIKIKNEIFSGNKDNELNIRATSGSVRVDFSEK